MSMTNDLFWENEYGYGFDDEIPERIPDMDEFLRESIARHMEHLTGTSDVENLMLEQAYYAAWKKKEKKQSKGKRRKKDE